MSSVIRELQNESIDNKASASVLLRKTLAVATKLKQESIIEWVKHELEGYPLENWKKIYPSYRLIRGIVKAEMPNGLYKQVSFKDSKVANSLSIMPCFQSSPEIEHSLNKMTKEGEFQMHFPEDTAVELMNTLGYGMRPFLHVDSSALCNVLESVRLTILKWSLKLEEDGVLDEGLSFSEKEKEIALGKNYNINLFTGSVVNSQIQQGSIDSSQDFQSV